MNLILCDDDTSIVHTVHTTTRVRRFCSFVTSYSPIPNPERVSRQLTEHHGGRTTFFIGPLISHRSMSERVSDGIIQSRCRCRCRCRPKAALPQGHSSPCRCVAVAVAVAVAVTGDSLSLSFSR